MSVKHLGLFLLAIFALSSVYVADTAYAASHDGHAADDKMHATPYQQVLDGVPADMVQCNEPRSLYIMDVQTPVCLTDSGYDTLVNRGFDLMMPASVPEPSMPAPEPSLSDILDSIDNAGEADVQEVVAAVITMYEFDKEGTFAAVNAASENVVLHYPFIVDPETRTIVAHGADPDRIGTPTAVMGEYATQDAADLLANLKNSGGAWSDYLFLDPASNEERLKHSWLVLYDGYIFGSGYYYSVEERARIVIDKTIDLYKAEGAEAFDTINTDRAEEHATVVDLADPQYWVVAASWYAPESIGHAYGPPEFGEDLKEALDNAENGVWIYGYSHNPVSGEDATYVSLNKMYDNYLFGRGYTYPAEEKVQAVVNDAIRTYDSDKDKEDPFGRITQESLYPHYVFVVDPENQIIVAHGSSPERLGTKLVFSDTYERSFDEVLADLQSNGTTWAEYEFPYPDSSATEKKRSFLALHEGYIFGSGYYKSTYVVHEDLVLGIPDRD